MSAPTPEELGRWLELYLEAGGALSGFTLGQFLQLDQDEQAQAVLAGKRFWNGQARRLAGALREALQPAAPVERPTERAVDSREEALINALADAQAEVRRRNTA